ncbi:MAG: F0F1 ATP synthase subunit delta [Hyphomicrobiales bacterium]|nr:F0F1 ATP synthase subunit delta [Hyphomicrobiales bacterium]MBV9741896.1 F0F1 ATP synthase subunit delta [Hyphomicrobiales bacterium]
MALAARWQWTGSRVAQVETSMSGVAGRYAVALFELASENGQADAVSADLERFAALVEASDELKRLVRSPVFTPQEQEAAVGAILDRVGIAGIAGNFIRLVAQKRRLFALPAMTRAYEALLADRKGIVPAEVTVAEPMPEAMMGELKSALRKAEGKEVALSVKINPDIIGGMVVKLGHRMIDASLKTKLNALRVAMREVR